MRVTSTNSGPDSKGVVRFGNWELEGEAYLFVVVGAVGTLLVFIMSASLGAVPRAFVSLLPIILAVGWVKFFLVGRPPHFTGDFMEKLAVGRHFNLRPQVWAQWPHPRGHRPRPPLAAVKGGPR